MNLKKLTKFSFTLLLSILACLSGMAQERVIKGTITDKDGKPVEGVSVVVKGTTRSTITDAKGAYGIPAAPDETLEFTHISYATKEVKVGEHPTIDIKLAKGDSQMDDVIVIGYGSQKRAHLTGSVVSIDMSKVQDFNTGSLSEALKGQVVGVSVSGGFARPGQPATITVRNPIYFSKDGGSKDPLYIIDDVYRTKSDFDLLDPSEIETISVLKDAAAAIYGIWGSNGVIIVKTKRGKAGAFNINYNTSVGITDATKMPTMMSGYDEAVYLNDFNTLKYGKFDSTKSDFYFQDELDYFKNNNYNWLDMAWQKATQMRHALNISGGNDRATYFAGLSYETQNSNFSGARFNRYGIRASTDIKLATGLKLGLSLSGNLGDSKNTFNKQGSESLDNDWKTLIGESPFDPPFVNGLPILIQGAGTSSNINTYHYFAVHNSNNYTQALSNSLNFLGSLSYDFPFLKGLRASVAYNRNLNNQWGKQYGTFYNVYQFNMLGGNKHIYGDSVTAVYQMNNGDRVRLNPQYTDQYQLNASLNYNKSFGKHTIGVLVGYEQSETHSDGVAGMAQGVLPNGLDNQNFATGTQTSTETISEVGRLAYFGRLDYNYASKYILQFQLRGDASQNFAPENRWGYFPSVSAGWVISEEPFFNRLLNTVNYLKLRGSYGHLGLDATKAYQWMRTYAIQTGKAAVFGGNSDRGLGVQTDVDLANRNVHWDNIDKVNGGLDMKFLNNRLSASADGFIDFRRDMLSNLTSSPSFLIGTPVPTENFASANTFGTEISVNWRDQINRDWSYNVTANFTWYDNKYLKVDNSSGTNGTYLDPTGKSGDMGYLGYHALGMFRTQADVDAWLAKYPNYKLFGTKPAPGMLYYEDVRGPQDASGKFTDPDGTITVADQQFLTKKSDNHYGLGLNWGVSYKTITLSVMMGMSWGGQGAVEGSARKAGSAYSNRPDFWKDHWTPDNPNAKYPAPYYTVSYDVNSDFWFKSSYSFRVNNFNLSYSIPQRWASAAGFSNARLYLVGTNPLNLFNPYSYKDNVNGSYDVYPVLKTWNLGLNLNL